jgi:hypothetical protein
MERQMKGRKKVILALRLGLPGCFAPTARPSSRLAPAHQFVGFRAGFSGHSGRRTAHRPCFPDVPTPMIAVTANHSSQQFGRIPRELLDLRGIRNRR